MQEAKQKKPTVLKTGSICLCIWGLQNGCSWPGGSRNLSAVKRHRRFRPLILGKTHLNPEVVQHGGRLWKSLLLEALAWDGLGRGNPDVVQRSLQVDDSVSHFSAVGRGLVIAVVICAAPSASIGLHPSATPRSRAQKGIRCCLAVKAGARLSKQLRIYHTAFISVTRQGYRVT